MKTLRNAWAALAATTIILACSSATDTPAGLSISPEELDLAPTETGQFVALLEGVPEQAVAWSVAEPDGGTIDASGTYTAPDAEGTYTVVATLSAPSLTRAATVRVTRKVHVAVSPETTTVVPGETVALSAAVSGTLDKRVTWSIAEGGGTVDADGRYTAPSTPGVATVVATSVADPSKSAAARVTVAEPPEEDPGEDPPPAGPTLATPAYFVAHGGSDSNPGTISAPWRTLAYAMNRLRPGDTLYIRGSTSRDTDTACSGNGAQGGACWTETESCRGTTCSPIHWTSGSTHFAGTQGKPITIASYPGETVIIEPSRGTSVVQMEPKTGGGQAAGQAGNAHCSWVILDGLILDGRNQTNQVVWILPATSTITDPVTTMCSNGAIKNSVIRHGRSTGGIQAYTYRWDFLNNEIYQTGSNGTQADRDHAIYTQGQYNRIIGGRIHHNLHGIQTEAVGRQEPGHLLIEDVEIDNNGYNPWNGVSRNGSTGHILLLEHQGKNASVRNCRIHDNDQNAINVGAGWSTTLVTGVTIENNAIWGNANSNDVGGCGPSIWVRSGSAPSCKGNVSTPR